MQNALRAGFWIVAVLLVAAATGETAEARQLWLESFDAEIVVEPDGTVRVEERIRVHFQGSWNGILRYVPYRYQIRGVRGSIRLAVDAIEDTQGTGLEYWSSRSGGQIELKIRVPGARDSTQTVVIRYHAQNVIRLYDEDAEEYGAHDELYWNVTGTGWPNRIEHASARIRLPEGVPAESVKTRMHVGHYGSHGDAGGRATHTVAEDGAHVFEVDQLRPYEGLTIVVGFEPGHVAHPSWFTKAGWFIQDNYFLLFPLLLLFGWWMLWRKLGRDDISDRTVIPEFEAPMALRPAEVGVIADDTFDQRDMTASIVDLAVRGVVTIKYHGKGESTQLTRHKDQEAAADLRPYESMLISALFKGKETIRLSGLKYKFHTRLRGIRSAAAKRLVRDGFFHKQPSDVRSKWNVFTFIAVAALIGFGIAAGWPAPYWAAVVLCAIPMFVIARFMPRRTQKGLQALARTRGLEDYLETAEDARLRELPLAQLETLIPFAIALGVGDRWLDAFARIYTQQPGWITTAGSTWDAGMLRHTTNEIESDVGKSLYSGPRPRATTSGGSSSFGGSWSGGSGFSSGGGFSGGGFGGGGGGGW